jgi:hypothetical protein
VEIRIEMPHAAKAANPIQLKTGLYIKIFIILIMPSIPRSSTRGKREN